MNNPVFRAGAKGLLPSFHHAGHPAVRHGAAGGEEGLRLALHRRRHGRRRLRPEGGLTEEGHATSVTFHLTAVLPGCKI